MILADEYEHAGVKVEIHQEDEGAEYANPRDHDNLGIMFCWHPDYILGDEQFGQFGGREDLAFHQMEDAVRYLQDERGALVILPLFLLDHSGITIRAGEPILGDPGKGANQERMMSRGRFMGDDRGWDTTHVGFIFTNQEKLDETGAPPEDAIKQLREEVKEYDLYLTGQVYGYIVGKDTPFEESCFGFVCDLCSDDAYVHEAAKEAAEGVAEKLERESREAAEWAARDTVTI